MYCRVPGPDEISGDKRVKSNEQKPKNVPEKLWEKFQALQKRTDDVTRRSTEKRIKHLQRKVMDDVEEQITLPEDKDILRQHDVKFGPPVNDYIPGKKRKLEENIPDSNELCTPETSSKQWGEIKQYLGVNDHLKGIDPGKYAPKTKLDDAIDEAVNKGQFEKAEKISDQLSTREFGKKISDAIDARDYIKVKKEEEESSKAKKKKKLPWGFAHKQRWETKSNM